jgi:hypothetical protein
LAYFVLDLVADLDLGDDDGAVVVRVCGRRGEHPHFTTINEFRGTKMKANASKHKAMSYDRMAKEELRLKAEVEQLISQAEAVDAAEDKLYGVGEQPKDLPAELQRREGRREKIRELRAALEQEAAKARALELTEMADDLRGKAAEATTSAAQRETCPSGRRQL